MKATTLNHLPPDGAPLPHEVSTAPFEPYATEAMTPEQERVYLASQWQLMWWKFRKHRLAVISANRAGSWRPTIPAIPHIGREGSAKRGRAGESA